MKKIIWAVVFILFDINIAFEWGTLHFLPEVVGYILLLLAIDDFNNMGADRSSWRVMMPIFIGISGISFVVDLVGWANIDSVMYIILIFTNIIIRVIAIMSILNGMYVIKEQQQIDVALGYSLVAIVLIGFCSISSVLAMSISALSTFLWVVAVLMSIGVLINIGAELNCVKSHLEKQNDSMQQDTEHVQDNDNTQQSCDEAQGTNNV